MARQTRVKRRRRYRSYRERRARRFAQAQEADATPQWRQERLRLRDNPEFQKYCRRDARRGTNRDMYQLLDRIFSSTPLHCVKGIAGYKGPHSAHQPRKPELMIVQTRSGPKRATREVLRSNRKLAEEERRVSAQRERRTRERRARRALRRLRRRRG